MTSLYPSRAEAARRGNEAVSIILDGGYVAPSSTRIELRDDIERARAATVSYAPTDAIPAWRPRAGALRIQVENTSSLAAARTLTGAGHDVCVLNFASAKNPGGGFRTGARAQEESLCCASALFACLDGDRMYEHHRARHDPLYTAWAIYSPGVPVFRADDGRLLEAPWHAAFITAPAPNAKVVLERDASRTQEIAEALRTRVWRVLGIAAGHGHDALVLGAWGCGVFGNSPAQVAALFDEALRGDFAGAFSRVTFAVLDSSDERRFIGPFESLVR